MVVHPRRGRAHLPVTSNISPFRPQASSPRSWEGFDDGECPVASSAFRQLITHNDYVVEMVDLINKEMDLDPCAEQSSEDLGASRLYDLSKVCSYCLWYCVFSLNSLPNNCLTLGVGANESILGQMRGQRGGDLSILQVSGD